MPLIRRAGSATVIALEDGVGTFFRPRQEVFPKASAADWARADALDPGAVTPDGQWLLRFRCFAICLDSGETVLVDAGIGPAGSPAAAWAPVPGRLPEELAAAAIDREAVSAVVLTHLHTDHIGWAVVGDGEAARPYFPNARYVLQRAEVAALESPTLAERLLDPLRATDQLHLVDGTTRLGPGVLAVHTPGHTPGHQCVLVGRATRPSPSPVTCSCTRCNSRTPASRTRTRPIRTRPASHGSACSASWPGWAGRSPPPT